MTETLEKEETKQEEEKTCGKFEEKLYEEIKHCLNDCAKPAMEEICGKIQDTSSIDALSRILREYLNKNAENKEIQEKLLNCMAFSIMAYMTRQVITETINKNIAKQCMAKAAFDCIDIDKCIGVKATSGERTGVAIIPKDLIENKNDDEIIEFAKTMPNFTEENLQDAIFEILKDEELKNEFSKAQRVVNKGKVGDVTETIIMGEEEKCQN